MKKRLTLYFYTFFVFASLNIQSIFAQTLPAPVPHQFLTPEQYSLLEEILNTHLNYFLSNDVMTSSGLPLGAYKEGDRARYGYSNPTEWGYALQALIVAADRGIITTQAATLKIETALNTMIALQNNSTQNYHYLFYPYYKVTSPAGVDLNIPYHDTNTEIPSIDNGFLYTTLLIIQGWASINDLDTIESKAKSISDLMNFRVFMDPSKKFMHHIVNAQTGKLDSGSGWNIFSDEGGMMAWIAYLSNSVSLDEYKVLIDNMQRTPRDWNNILVKEAAWYNSMFAWGVRSLSGFPVTEWETGIPNQYSLGSFKQVVKANLAYGDSLGAYYPAFSDAMTQGYVGKYFPPNLPNNVPTIAPYHAVPHAFFIPFNIGPDLDQADLNALISKITNLKSDLGQYYHNGTDTHKPFGFEVTTSTAHNNMSYVPPSSRYIYETLSEAYVVLSVQQGLNLNDGEPTFLNYAAENPGYFTKVQQVLNYLYSSTNQVRRVPTDFSTIQAAINASSSGDTVLVLPGTYNESIILNKNGVTIAGEDTAGNNVLGSNTQTILNGSSGVPVITCTNLSGTRKARITGFTINGGSAAIQCDATVNAIQIDNNTILNSSLILNTGASAVIKNNTILWTLYGNGNNNVEISANFFDKKNGATQVPGIQLNSATGLIQENYFFSRWDGAITLNGNSNVQIIRNKFKDCHSWDAGSGINIYGSTATLWNNTFSGNDVANNGSSACVSAQSNSTVFIYNNTFVNNSSLHGTSRGIAIYTYNSNIAAKNNIFSGNSNAANTVSFEGTGTQDFSYNDFWNNTTTQLSSGVTFGIGNIYQDPLFEDTLNFQTLHGSPAEDAGDPASQFNDLNASLNDIGISGGPYGKMSDYILNMTEMPWYQNTSPYNSTGAATSQMIINYIKQGVGLPDENQSTIYEYAKSPQPFGSELNANEMAKVLGHFDPYDNLISSWANSYNSLPGGNPYKGYNFSVDSYGSDAIDQYMRDISHWMAFTVNQKDWWDINSPLVARPNTPAAVPLFGSYNHWVAVKGVAASTNPCPFPRTNPFMSPGFIIYGFWMKDPLISGIGQNTYKTAAECKLTYFSPLSQAGDPYNGKFVHVSEPPSKKSDAKARINQPAPDQDNLEFIGIPQNSSVNSKKSKKRKKLSWRDIVDQNFLNDMEAVNAFTGSKMGKALKIKRLDDQGEDYYLVPFNKEIKKNNPRTIGVIILNANNGSFKEASWTKAPERFLKVSKKKAIKHIEAFIAEDLKNKLTALSLASKKDYKYQMSELLKDYKNLFSYIKDAKGSLVWKPQSLYSSSPYQPYWQLDIHGNIWYVNQDGKVKSETDLSQITDQMALSRNTKGKNLRQ